MPGEADGEPAVRVKGSGRVECPADDGGQGGARLRRRQAIGKLIAQRECGQQMKSAAPIRERSAKSREAAVGPDEALQDRAVPPGAVENTGAHVTPGLRFIATYPQHVEQHRLNHEAVVVVPVEAGTIAVHAVAPVPLLVLAQRVVHAEPIPRCAEQLQARLDRGSEHEPVAEPWRDRASRRQRLYQPSLRCLIQRAGERMWSAEQALREERRVHKRLRLVREVQGVR